jgi:hypothetical protein
MALFPITGRYVGDFVPHLVAVDTEDTMDQVAQKVAAHSVGRRLPEPAGGPVYDVYLGDRRLDPTTTLGSLGLAPLQWLAVREAVEHALVEFDWDRVLVATQLVVKPVADLLFLDESGRQLVASGATLDGMIAENLARDARRSRRWTGALLRFLADAGEANVTLLQRYLRRLGTARSRDGRGRVPAARRGRRAPRECDRRDRPCRLAGPGRPGRARHGPALSR